MHTICVPIPSLKAAHTVDLEMTVDGKRRLMQYRVESFNWMEGGAAEARYERLRRFVEAYAEDWHLVQIGLPEGDLIPITFRRQLA